MGSKHRDCLFCGRSGHAKMTLEHAWPQWLRALLPPKESGVAQSWTPGIGKREWNTGPEPGFTLKQVCTECNSKWMSNLENEVKPILSKLVIGVERIDLSVGEQLMLCRWVTKTLMVFEALGKRKRVFFQPLDRKGMAAGKLPNVRTRILLGHAQGVRGPLFTEFKTIPGATDFHGRVRKSVRTTSCVVTMLIGRLIVQGEWHRIDEDDGRPVVVFMSNFWNDKIMCITRPYTVLKVQWPPPTAMNEDCFDLFRQRFEIEAAMKIDREARGIPWTADLRPQTRKR